MTPDPWTTADEQSPRSGRRVLDGLGLEVGREAVDDVLELPVEEIANRADLELE